MFFLFTSYYSLVTSQNFVKKDSSEVVPFIAKKYFSENIDLEQPSSNKINSIHRLSSRFNSENEFLLQGNFGSALIPVLYEKKFKQQLELRSNLSQHYFYNQENIPYYALNKPLSEMDFIFFGNGNEEFNGFLSQNLSRKINIGVGIKRSNNLGYFINQANLHNNFYITGVYQSKRWRSNLEVVFNELVQKENGGLQQDIYREEVTPGLWKAANPNFIIGKNEIHNFNINFRNRWLISLDTNRHDSLLFIPIRSKLFVDNELKINTEDIDYSDSFNPITRSLYGVYNHNSFNTIYSKIFNQSLSNEFSIHYQLKNYQFKVYNFISLNDIEQSKFKNTTLTRSTQDFNFGLGGEFKINMDSANFTFKSYKSLLGYTQDNMLISGQLDLKINNWKLNLASSYKHQLPEYFYNYSYSNTLESNNKLKTQKTWENALEISNVKHQFKFKLQYFSIDDFLTFDTLSRPIQIQNNFFQVSIQKEWSWKSLYFPTMIMYQNSLFHRGLIRQTLAYRNKLFSDKNNIIVGADLSLNYDNVEPRYNPLLMQQLYSESMLHSEIYPKLDLFATFKISKVHVSLIMDNFLSTYMKTGYSPTFNNPITPSAFYFRANWVFLE